LSDSALIEIGSTLAGTRTRVDLPVTMGLNGQPLALSAHVLRGVTPGPVVALLSTLHGNEWFSIFAMRRLVESLDPQRLRGTVIVVPVANPPAFGRLTRNMPDPSDSPDLNRVFPGQWTWTSDLIAATLTDHVLRQATCLLDFHVGPWGHADCDILIGDDLPPEVAAESERLALAFGSPIVRRSNVVSSFPGPRSAIGYAGNVLGIPSLGVEIGGAGFAPELERAWIQSTVDGVLAVFGALEMIENPPDPRPVRQLVYRNAHRVNPRVGGWLHSRYGGDRLGQPVTAGTLLGAVHSPYTDEIIEELRAPVDGLLYYVSRNYPVHPGGWAFGIAASDGDARWVENPSRQTPAEEDHR
jgi:predicted deacylase